MRAKRRFSPEPIVVVLVRKTHVIQDRPVLDCWDPKSGLAWNDVPIVAPGGSKGGSFHVPTLIVDEEESGPQIRPVTPPPGGGEAETVPQAVIAFTRRSRMPYCLGFLFDVRTSLKKSGGSKAGGGAFTEAPTVADLFIRNANSKAQIILKEEGDVIIDQTAVDQDADHNHKLKIQLNDKATGGIPDGLIQIFSGAGSSDPTERLILANAWIDYWNNKVLPYFSKLEADIATVSTNVATHVHTVAGAVPAVVGVPPVASPSGQAAVPTAIQSVDVALGVSGTSADSLKSGLIHIDPVDDDPTT